MKHLAMRVIGAITLLVLLGACATGASGSAPPQSKNATVTAASTKPCAAGALALRYGPVVVPMTGEHAVMYKIRNRGHVACSLSGYPAVTLYSSKGHRLAFRYTDGHSMYVTKARPKTVDLAPGRSAYVLVAKYRCDLGDLATAATIRLTLPGRARITLTGSVSAPRSGGVADLAYCKGGPKDPGQKVATSPIEATGSAAGPF